ncbi:M16 family metallopeptidase [Sediminitomix flava]|uniref:Zinc protease n=1 Tax=Sediminitomix flava TaxID=379075 RepID=A0A315ZHY6_SEDFL|nr:M16 family metallopeptidase [Sediminitomix flava]PWJ44912.1 zinc protease [Sediminitomix flava]
MKHTNMKKVLLSLTAFFICITTIVAQEQSFKLDQEIPFNSDVKRGKLSNGLSYYIQKHEEPKDKAELRLVVKAGSILEEDDQQGLAHFLEHMAFNGSKNFEKNDVVEYLQSIGVRFGADLNAYTSFDETVYMLPIPTEDEEKFDKGLLILRDWAGDLSLNDEDIDEERGVIKEEWRMGKGAEERMRKQTYPVLTYNSKYEHRLPIGTMEVVENFKYDRIRQFYKDWYRPNLMGVIVVGDIDADKVEEKIKKLFGDLKNPANEKERVEFDIPSHDSTLVKVVTDPEATYYRATIYYKQEAQEEKTLGDFRRSLLDQIYTGMLNQRLYEVGTKPDSPYMYAGNSFSDFLGNQDAYALIAIPKEGQIEPSIERLIVESNRIKEFGFTESELERYKVELMTSVENAYNERDKISSAQLAQDYVQSFLHNENSPGIAFSYEFVKSVLPSITLGEINALTSKFVTNDNRIVIVEGPEKEGVTLPTEADVLDTFNKANEIAVTAYVDEVSGQELLPASDLAPAGKIVSEKEVEELGVTVLKLDNNTTVTLKPTDFKNDEILMTGHRYGGYSLASLDSLQSASRASTIVSMGGLRDIDAIQLDKLLAGKTASASVSINQLSERASGSATPKDLETMFELLYLKFTAPRKDQERFNVYLSNLKEQITNARKSPNSLFSDLVSRTLAQDNPRVGGIPTDEDLAKIDLDEALDFYQKRFSDASGFHFYLVGNFDTDSIKPMIEKYIGALPAKQGVTHSYVDHNIVPPSGIVKKEIKAGSEDKSTVMIYHHGEFSNSAKNRVTSSLLSSVLGNRVIKVLREEKGGVYSPYAGVSYELLPTPEQNSTVYFTCAPDKVEDLIEASLQVMDDVKEEVTEEDLNKAVQASLRTRKENLRKNGFWLSVLSSSDFYNLGYDLILNYDDVINSVKTKDVEKAAKKYFIHDNYCQFVLFPKS